MNVIHRWLCGSRSWGKLLEERVVPWTLSGADLGQSVLELGPGPGLATDVLRARAARITAIEIDRALANSLSLRLRGSNVTVVESDAARMPFAGGSFSGAVSFTMLHHVPSADLQKKLFQEVRRVLESNGVFAGMDIKHSLAMRLLHLGDTYVPVDPGTLCSRLGASGFRDIFVEGNRYAFRFRAVAA